MGAGPVDIRCGDCRDVLAEMEFESVDAIVTDPPYGLGFMGKGWDHGVPGVEFWTAAGRVLKPGGHLVAFGGTRTYHRLICAIEDAGFEIRDCLFWAYGQGFPKSLDVSKAIDKAAGVDREVVGVSSYAANRKPGRAIMPGGGGLRHCEDERPITEPATDDAARWDGWGTALKPAVEPVTLARKPLSEKTVAANVLRWGTGAINVDGCRVPGALGGDPHRFAKTDGGTFVQEFGDAPTVRASGRWPANLILSHALTCRKNGDVWECAPDCPVRMLDAQSAGASRFFYCAKASKKERNAGLDGDRNTHPTVKPVALMRYLCRLITPPGGTVLDPFAGSGSTGCAAIPEGFSFIGIEKDAESCAIAEKRVAHAAAEGGG